MNDTNNQKQHWEELHKKGSVDHELNIATEFAKEVNDYINPNSSILELGCGVGNDSFYFSQQGHKALGTDFSEVAIDQDKKRYNNGNLTFKVMDISLPIPFIDNEFDVVYARLSLHYFSNEATKAIFKELHRILKPNGYLCFICKSTHDPLYGAGTEIEKDMYEKNGHVRHFFNEEYVKLCLGNNFSIHKIQEDKGELYGNTSAFIKVIANNIK